MNIHYWFLYHHILRSFRKFILLVFKYQFLQNYLIIQCDLVKDNLKQFNNFLFLKCPSTSFFSIVHLQTLIEYCELNS